MVIRLVIIGAAARFGLNSIAGSSITQAIARMIRGAQDIATTSRIADSTTLEEIAGYRTRPLIIRRLMMIGAIARIRTDGTLSRTIAGGLRLTMIRNIVGGSRISKMRSR